MDADDGLCPQCNQTCIEYCDNDCGTAYCSTCMINGEPLEFHIGLESMEKILGHDLNCHTNSGCEDELILD